MGAITTHQRPTKPLPDPNEQPLMAVPEAGAYLGLALTASYNAIKPGCFLEPTVVRNGKRIYISTAKFRRLLGLDA